MDELSHSKSFHRKGLRARRSYRFLTDFLSGNTSGGRLRTGLWRPARTRASPSAPSRYPAETKADGQKRRGSICLIDGLFSGIPAPSQIRGWTLTAASQQTNTNLFLQSRRRNEQLGGLFMEQVPATLPVLVCEDVWPLIRRVKRLRLMKQLTIQVLTGLNKKIRRRTKSVKENTSLKINTKKYNCVKS